MGMEPINLNRGRLAAGLGPLIPRKATICSSRAGDPRPRCKLGLPPQRLHGSWCRQLQLRRATKVASAAGNGGSGGSNGIGGGGGGGGGGGSSEGGFSIWSLVSLFAAGTAVYSVYLQRRDHQPAADAEEDAKPPKPDYDSEPIRALKRLMRDAFGEILSIRGRVDELERTVGIDSSRDDIDGASQLTTASSSARQLVAARARPVQALTGTLSIGGGLLWAEDESNPAAADSLNGLGIRLGTDVVMQIGGSVRSGSDRVLAEFSINPADDHFGLRKVIYHCRLLPFLSLALAPFGATGADAAYTLNPHAGKGLTSLVREGSPLHQRQMGSLVGAGVDLKRAWINAGYFTRAGEDGASATVLAQAVVAPTNFLSAGLTYVEQAGEGKGVTIGGTVLGGTSSLPTTLVGGARADAESGSTTVAPPALAATAALRLGSLAALHGWATGDYEMLKATVEGQGWKEGVQGIKGVDQWGLMLGSYPISSGSGWTLAMGHVAGVIGAEGSWNMPNVYEASVAVGMGDGLVVSPGVVVVRQGTGSTAFAGLKSSWSF